MNTHKHRNKENLSHKSLTLFTCKLAFEIRLVKNQNLKKGRLHCIDINGDHCV